ncbi:MAG: fatty acid hydroxylase family protein [Betaproteobacteria bacterium]|nr:fatty acid hydroxylase family protein [Betaproteobacteria bacterium]
MMTEKQRKFREKYVSEISPWYHGLVHIGVMYVAGISAIAWCVSQLKAPTWEWLLIVPIAIAGNFVEWGMHMHVMHRLKDVFALRAIYDRHTRQHHQYFTDNDVEIHSVKEFRIVFFPWRVLIVLAVASAVFGYTASLVLGPNAGFMFPITMIGHYMVYETFHVCCHLPENAFVRNAPFISTIRRHHTAHHNMGIMMHLNMNLTFPVADWFMNTSDLNRGLLGHLFNGYDETHQKPELKPLMAKFRTAKVEEERVTLEGPKLGDEEIAALSAAGRVVQV